MPFVGQSYRGASIVLALLSGCAFTAAPPEADPEFLESCMKTSSQRVEAALASSDFGSDGASLIVTLLNELPRRERAAIRASLEAARKSLGHELSMADAPALRSGAAFRAFVDGFDIAPTCHARNGSLTVEYFTSSVLAYLYERNVDVTGVFLALGSPPNEHNTDHEELKVWLLLGAAGAL